ncbi:hypothetical protein GCM10020295_34450 [Streptomyces cinereospinus]
MSGWEAGLDDEEAGAVMRTVVRQLKLWREAAGLTQAEFGAAIGYGEELVSSVERGRRIPRPEYLDAADEVCGAGGKIAALKRDVAEVRYPKKVRDVKRLEAEAVEICSYNNSVIDGLLQIEVYARAVFGSRRPQFAEEELEQRVAARLDRQEILWAPKCSPAPQLRAVRGDAAPLDRGQDGDAQSARTAVGSGPAAERRPTGVASEP